MSTGFFSRKPAPDAGSSAGQVLLRPTPPLAKRLNRNALTVAAVIMGMTVLTAIVVMNPSHEGKKAAGGQAVADEPPVPSRPAFLDEPVRTPPNVPSARRDSVALVESASTVGGRLSSPELHDGDESARGQSVGLNDVSSIDASNGAAPTMPSGREQAYQAALASATIVGAPQGPSGGATQTANGSLGSAEEQLVALGDSILRSSTRQPANANAPAALPTQGAGGASLASPESRRRTFMEQAGDTGGTTVLAQLEPAGSPFTLRAGTVIPGALITAINSDLPGQIVGQVSRNVYDSRSQRVLLIPKGSRLIGTYDNQVAAGQGRLLVAWTRLILPDGRSMRLPGLALKDPQGQTGAKDKVDNHWRRVFGNALLLSAISAGVQLSQPQQSTVLASPSAGQVAAGALGQELSNVALEIIRRGMDVAPTLTIRAGQPFYVFLNGALVFDGPYQEEPGRTP